MSEKEINMSNKYLNKENILAILIGILLVNTFYTYISSTWYFHHIKYVNTILTIAAFIILISFLVLYMLKKYSFKKMFISIIVSIVLNVLFYAVFAAAVLVHSNYVNALLMVAAFIILLTLLVFLYLYISKKNSSKLVIALTVVIVVGAMFLAVLTISDLVSIKNKPAYYFYGISVQGLENYGGNMATDILVPMPVKDGIPILSDEDLQYKHFGNWTSMIVVTKYGKMIAFQSKDKNLTDISANFIKNAGDGLINMTGLALYPVSSENNMTNYTMWVGGSENVRNNSTYVFIDPYIKTNNGNNGTITFRLKFVGDEGKSSGITGDVYEIQIVEDVPVGVIGPIPVMAQVI
jgi:hypothetical protein